eukprot:PhM_4_TR10552/c0_g1_i1/m.60526
MISSMGWSWMRRARCPSSSLDSSSICLFLCSFLLSSSYSSLRSSTSTKSSSISCCFTGSRSSTCITWMRRSNPTVVSSLLCRHMDVIVLSCLPEITDTRRIELRFHTLITLSAPAVNSIGPCSTIVRILSEWPLSSSFMSSFTTGLSHTRMCVSAAPVMSRPSGSSTIAHTVWSCACIDRSIFRRIRSHTNTRPSTVPLKRCMSLHVIAFTGPSWPPSVATQSPVSVFHCLTVVSSLPVKKEASRAPPSRTARPTTKPRCPSNVPNRVRRMGSHWIAVWSLDAEYSTHLSRQNIMLKTLALCPTRMISRRSVTVFHK